MLAVKVNDIHRAAAFVFNIPVDVLTSRSSSRCRRHCSARWAAMFLARKHTTMSYPQIGRYFGGRDHSTVIHGIRRIEGLAASDSDISASVTSVEAVAKKFAAIRTERDFANAEKIRAEGLALSPD